MAAVEDPAATAAAGPKPKGESVKVVVKVRPLFGKEITEGRERIVQMDVKRGVAILHKPGGAERDCKDFTFDAVFEESATQQVIYDDTASEIVDSVMDGFNGTIFCYGQTGAGKSFTMAGPEHCEPELQGLLPRSFRHIFANVDTSSHNIKYLVRGSFLEIYNEDIRDLLSKNPKDRCDLKDHPNGGVYVKDLSAFVVKTAIEMDQVLAAGLSNRSTGATAMNAESSRSHSIFLVTIEQCEIGTDGEGHIRVGKLNMVDLAGSERQSKTGATGDRLKEATKINLSLSALGNVISALVDGKSSHIPYRDSKLTRLLQDSLGGNTKTVMVANVGPADYNYDETLSTLRYAYRAKSIKNKPRINEDPKDAMIREFQDEIMRLKSELANSGEGGPVDLTGIPPEMHHLFQAGAPLPPKIQKEIVTKEVEVEKIIEKEVIIEQGPTPEEVAAMEKALRSQNEEVRLDAERKRAEIEQQRDLAEAERQKYLVEVDREEKAAMAEQQRRMQMQTQLQQMEQKMVVGKQVMEKAIEQEEELKRQQRELRKQKKVENKLKEKEDQQRLENLELETKCASQEEQVQKLTSKLQKLWDKYQKAQQEMVDIQEFNQGEREDMLSMIRELRQTQKLKTLIMESFVPQKEVQSVKERASWDAEEDEWVLQPVKIDKTNRPVRPTSCFGLPRPTAEFTRLNHAMGDPNPRYMFDSIVITDLDLPERTTEDFETHPDLGDRVERSLLLALSPEDDDSSSKKPGNNEGGDDRQSRGEKKEGSGRPMTGSQKKRPSSGRPGTGRRDRHDAPPPGPAFPQARGLVSQE